MSEQDFLVRDTRMPGHFWADNEVWDILMPEVGGHAFAVYMGLCRNATNGTGECRIALSKIAEKTRWSKSTIHKAMKELVGARLVQLVEPGGPRATSLYLLADVKSLVDPHVAQLRLSKLHPSVRPQNASGVESSPTEPSVRIKHGLQNAAFAHRTPLKEERLSSRLKTKSKTENSCELHPDSGLTNWGTCWGCYAEKRGAEASL